MISLKPNQEKQILKGYPWVFANQIRTIEGNPKRGDIVPLFTHSKCPLGQGFYHDTSQIALRLITFDTSLTINEAFFRDRLQRAHGLRSSIYGSETHYRLLFSESDGFPGTIVDRYDDVLTWTCLSYGMELWRDNILDLLEDLYKPRAIVERNDSWLRGKDDLPTAKGILRGSEPGSVILRENNVEFTIDPLNGPKTGFFMDQREHRAFTASLAKGKRVLDVCCADGGFGLQAAHQGAASVHFIDSSSPALERVAHNAQRNGLQDSIVLDEADALERLGELVKAGEQYDLVILDPPAFAKSRRHIETATRAYQRLNISGMQLLSKEGILATSSCSQAIKEADFLKTLRYAAKKSNTSLNTLYRGYQPPDHPVLDSMPETHYLKFFLFQKRWQ
ncbi:MAG: class I SAM-dependent rRNA methyltransferase [Rhodothermaceae bacterium]|nr:class I SAM-dependent rRNA methyltransferase [Rhodothermaceae bacterium]